MIITPTFSDATTMHINGEFTVHFNNDIPQISWSNGSSSSHLPFVVINFPSVITLAQNGYHDVYAFLPKYIYNDLNIRTEGYLTQECNQQVYFSSVNKGRATVERNTWYDIPVKADSWSAGVRGNGTPELPFELGSQTDIEYINGQIKSRDVNAKNYFAQANYVLTKDITINKNWTEAIACSVEKDGAKAFNGVFDGQGHTFKIASGYKATRPLFYDVKGGVIKNLIIDGQFQHQKEGDAAGTVTFSPFFYSAQNAYMVACAFKGNVYKCSDGNVNPDLTKPAIFGAMNNTCHLIACTYTQDGMTVYQGVQLNGDSSTISDVQNVEIYNTIHYNQVIGRLNGALGTWNNNGSTPDIAKTPYIFTYPTAKPSEFYLVKPNN